MTGARTAGIFPFRGTLGCVALRGRLRARTVNVPTDSDSHDPGDAASAAPVAVPAPLRPGEGPGAFRAGDLVRGIAVGIAALATGGVAGGFLGAWIGEVSHEPYGGVVGLFFGVGVGGFLGLLIALAAAWRRRAAPGFRVGLAILLGLTGLLTSACFLGI